MTPRDWFGVIIRSVGLLNLTAGLYYCLTTAYVAIASKTGAHSPPTTYALYAVFFVLLSLYFLRGAPGLMNFSYPNSKTNR